MSFNEADTRAKLIDPAIHRRGWTEDHIRREETAGAVEPVSGRRKRGQIRQSKPFKTSLVPTLLLYIANRTAPIMPATPASTSPLTRPSAWQMKTATPTS